jgi:hypothetical protein
VKFLIFLKWFRSVTPAITQDLALDQGFGGVFSAFLNLFEVSGKTTLANR